MQPPRIVEPLADDTDDWRKLAPLTLLLAVVRLGPKSLQMIPIVAAIGFTGRWQYALLFMLAGLMVSLGFAWATWVRFRWRVGDDGIVIESGLLERTHRTIPYDRIQDVSIEQGLVARLLDLAKVGFETGASADKDKDDGSLNAITLSDAENLRATVRAWRSEAATVTAPTGTRASADGVAADPAPADQFLFQMGPADIVRAGLFNFSLAALAVAAAAAQWFDDFLPINLFDPRVWFDIARQNGLGGWIAAHQWVTALGALTALVVVGFGTGIVRTAMINWNFVLSIGPRAFRRVRGLTTRTDVAIPVGRIQAAIVATGFVRRRWGWHELRVQSLASDTKDEKDHQLIPFGQLDDIDRVLTVTGLARANDALGWHWPPILYQVIIPLIAAAGLTVGGLAAIVMGYWQGASALVAAAILTFFTAMSARRHRWSEDNGHLYIWRGWWSPRLTILPFASVQSADLSDGPLLRRFGCAALTLGVPGESRMASHSIDALPDDQATDLRRRILRARMGTA